VSKFEYVRVLDSGGADTINIESVQYARMSDGAFYIEKSHADELIGHPGSGAYLAPSDYASPTSAPEGLVMSLIRGMAPSRLKTALLAASVSSAMQFQL
jgi:hypothetical protein